MKQSTQAPSIYPKRASVGNDPFDWKAPGYEPHFFEAGMLHRTPIPQWACDRSVDAFTRGNRMTFHSRGGVGLSTLFESALEYDDVHGMYLNPAGKTGLIGRGILGWYGPNQAADNIVTRDYKGVMQVLLVEKHSNDGSALAFPAGMVEPGQDVLTTLKQELVQEAVAGSEYVDKLFETCWMRSVYEGVVDDFRNTDWAWIETNATWFHATAEIADGLTLRVTDTEEIRNVQWINIDDVDSMYASHLDWLNIVKLELHHLLPKSNFFVSHDMPEGIPPKPFVSHEATEKRKSEGKESPKKRLDIKVTTCDDMDE
jgi:ADP-ribose pyrophosphatase